MTASCAKRIQKFADYLVAPGLFGLIEQFVGMLEDGIHHRHLAGRVEFHHAGTDGETHWRLRILAKHSVFHSTTDAFSHKPDVVGRRRFRQADDQELFTAPTEQRIFLANLFGEALAELY